LVAARSHSVAKLCHQRPIGHGLDEPRRLRPLNLFTSSGCRPNPVGSQARRRRLRRRRERVQSEDTRYRRQLWAPRAPSPRTRVATEARGWRSTFRRSIARLVPQPGQNTSSHGVPAISAARIVGDHSMSRLAASCSFQRSTALCLGARAALATCRFALMATSTPRVRTPIAAVPARNRPLNPAGGWRAAAADS
jgi:hypothetical protein